MRFSGSWSRSRRRLTLRQICLAPNERKDRSSQRPRSAVVCGVARTGQEREAPLGEEPGHFFRPPLRYDRITASSRNKAGNRDLRKFLLNPVVQHDANGFHRTWQSHAAQIPELKQPQGQPLTWDIDRQPRSLAQEASSAWVDGGSKENQPRWYAGPAHCQLHHDLAAEGVAEEDRSFEAELLSPIGQDAGKLSQAQRFAWLRTLTPAREMGA